MDPTIIRAAWILFTLLVCCAGILIYIIFALVFPDKSEVENSADNNGGNDIQ